MRRPSVEVQHYVACGVLATKELFHGRIYRKAHVPALSLRYRCADPGWRRERRVLGYGFRHLVWRLLRVHVLTLAAWPGRRANHQSQRRGDQRYRQDCQLPPLRRHGNRVERLLTKKWRGKIPGLSEPPGPRAPKPRGHPASSADRASAV